MTAPHHVTIKRALISVSDKTGIVDFARALQAQGIELLSTGGTYKLLVENQIPATEIADYTGFPEMMDGRVKTLHPKVHGGILARRGQDVLPSQAGHGAAAQEDAPAHSAHGHLPGRPAPVPRSAPGQRPRTHQRADSSLAGR